jgi:hypothetical protein
MRSPYERSPYDDDPAPPPRRSRGAVVSLLLLVIMISCVLLLWLLLGEDTQDNAIVDVQPSQTFTITASPSDTQTATGTFTPTTTFTPTSSPTPTDSPTPTSTPTPTNTPTPTATPIPPEAVIAIVDREAWLESNRILLNLPNLYAENEWPGILPGTRRLRYNAYVTITAGVDLELIGFDDIRIEGTTAYITLPPAQIKDCVLDETASSYFDRRCTAAGVVDAGCGGLEDDLREIARVEAARANHEIVLQDAFRNAAEVVQDLIEPLGLEEVIIEESQEPLPLVAQNGTCYMP